MGGQALLLGGEVQGWCPLPEALGKDVDSQREQSPGLFGREGGTHPSRVGPYQTFLQLPEEVRLEPVTQHPIVRMALTYSTLSVGI